VATTTSLNEEAALQRSTTLCSNGLPAISANGFPGKRVDA
jgi:hypothetical protein